MFPKAGEVQHGMEQGLGGLEQQHKVKGAERAAGMPTEDISGLFRFLGPEGPHLRVLYQEEQSHFEGLEAAVVVSEKVLLQ